MIILIVGINAQQIFTSFFLPLWVEYTFLVHWYGAWQYVLLWYWDVSRRNTDKCLRYTCAAGLALLEVVIAMQRNMFWALIKLKRMKKTWSRPKLNLQFVATPSLDQLSPTQHTNAWTRITNLEWFIIEHHFGNS